MSVDSCTILKREVKSNSYKLDDLGKEFLCETKIHLPYSEIRNQYQTTEGRTFLATYCLKDAWLSMKLLKHFDILHLYLSLANLTSLDLKALCQGGQGVKTYSLLYRKCQNQYFLPKTGKKSTASYEGAKMLCTPGLYKNPVICTDFASLYPSCIIAHNICYSTFQSDGTFSTREGIFPRMLKELLVERNKVKQKMKNATGLCNKQLNAKQKAIKLICNASYGFFAGYYICNEALAAAVTAKGRYYRHKAQEILEQQFKCKTVYSHTDSVYVCFILQSVNSECHQLGKKMAEHVTKVINVSQLRLEYENVYRPLLVVKKGQSAGMSYEPGKPPKQVIKGLKAKRSDTIPVARNLQAKVIHCILNNETETKIQRWYVKNMIE